MTCTYRLMREEMKQKKKDHQREHCEAMLSTILLELYFELILGLIPALRIDPGETVPPAASCISGDILGCSVARGEVSVPEHQQWLLSKPSDV